MGRRLPYRGLKHDAPGAEALRVRRTYAGEVYEHEIVISVMGINSLGFTWETFNIWGSALLSVASYSYSAAQAIGSLRLLIRRNW